MYRISIKPDLLKKIGQMDKQIAFGTRVAVTRTAHAVGQAERTEIDRVFDRPSSFTRRGVLVVPVKVAGNGRQFVAVVKLRDEASGGTAPSKYLQAQIEGGPRRLKGFEKQLGRSGMSEIAAGKFAVPGKGAKLDRYGNISQGTLIQILSALGLAEHKAGFQANRTERSAKRKGKRVRHFFMGRAGRGHRTLAVWERYGAGQRQIKPVIAIVEQPKYAKRFKFFEVAEKTIEREWPGQFERAISEALATAR